MKKLSFVFVLIFVLAAVSMISITQAVAQKESHKDYGAISVPECNDCHQGQGIVPNHDAAWTKGHGLPATRGQSNCSDCHQQSFCLDCHTGGGIDANLSTRNYRRDTVPKSHRNDFLEIHPLKAKNSPQSCNRCHDQKYCTSCHSKFKGEDLQFRSHRRQFRDIPLSSVGPNHAIFTEAQCRSCHPGGLLPSHRWAGDHAVEARRNLRACQTCHSEGDVCIKCHGARTGLKVNPHPRDWGSVKDKFKSKGGGRSCLRCHDKY
ncbi:MAG: cytochrome C [Thermodesulfobacteriota bacterium]